jgi:hypothetical protein
MITGTAYGELDPKSPLNAGTLNLQYAPLNARGHVEYSMDMVILKPLDINKGNGRLVYEVINRGHEKVLADMNLSKFTFSGPQSVTDPGTAMLMKSGYTVAWSGWEAEESVQTSRPGLMRAKFPVAMKDGKPIISTSREELSSVPEGAWFTAELTYPAGNMDVSAAKLTVRQREEDPRKPIAASDWSYVDAKHVRIKAAPGMDREALYELIYPATNAVIEGIAYPSIRDFVSFLRNAERDSTGQPNPVHPAAPFKAVLGVGISQSGRVIKNLIYEDFNRDSSGHMVFDGVMDLVSGARLTDMNMLFSQPGRFSRQHGDHLYGGDQFPFTYTTTTDPITGKTDGWLVKCTKSNTCPKIIHMDTDTDMWQARVSLVVTDPAGKPVAIPENVRMFVAAAVPHNGRDLGQTVAEGKPDRGICKQYRNPMEYRYYARALFTDLDEWVTKGVEPPASRYPSLQDGTLVTVDEAAKAWPKIPGVPFSRLINKLRPTDQSEQPPKYTGPEYPLYVPRTNADGNPEGGIQPPELTVPIATYSGRNVRRAGFAEGELCYLYGSYIPFAGTRKERMAANDPRPSLEERYTSEADFAAKRKQAADELVKARLLLPEDAATITSTPLPKTARIAARAK